jgi:hypothetical protein
VPICPIQVVFLGLRWMDLDDHETSKATAARIRTRMCRSVAGLGFLGPNDVGKNNTYYESWRFLWKKNKH